MLIESFAAIETLIKRRDVNRRGLCVRISSRFLKTCSNLTVDARRCLRVSKKGEGKGKIIWIVIDTRSFLPIVDSLVLFVNDGINYRIIFVNYSSMLSRLWIYIEGLFSI